MHARGNRAVTEFLNCLKTLVAERRRKPGNYDTDVLTRLIEGEKDGERLSETELYHQCIFMLNAGHETTTNLIGNGMWLLLTHPKALAQLRTNPALVPSAIEEMLRFEGPIQLNNRRLTAPMALGGKTLVDGTSITISIGGANRDPAQFPDPDKFDVARKPNRHLAFGQGDHACSGMNVARMEGRVAFSRLLARFPKIELAGEPERDRRIRFRGFRKLPVRV
jgi:cytochrome P450